MRGRRKESLLREARPCHHHPPAPLPAPHSVWGEIWAEWEAHLGKERARYCRDCPSLVARWSGESGDRIH